MARLLPITITAGPDGLFNVRAGAGMAQQQDLLLNWEEMLAQVASLTHLDVAKGLRGLRKPDAEPTDSSLAETVEAIRDLQPDGPVFDPNDPDFREIDEPARPAMAEIRMTPEAAYCLANELADLLWWAKGFNAARGPDVGADDRVPCLDRLRDVRSLLFGAANEARGVIDADLPF